LEGETVAAEDAASKPNMELVEQIKTEQEVSH